MKNLKLTLITLLTLTIFSCSSTKEEIEDIVPPKVEQPEIKSIIGEWNQITDQYTYTVYYFTKIGNKQIIDCYLKYTDNTRPYYNITGEFRQTKDSIYLFNIVSQNNQIKQPNKVLFYKIKGDTLLLSDTEYIKVN